MPPVKIRWFGHSGFSIQDPSGKVVLVDPWFQGNPSAPSGPAVRCTSWHWSHASSSWRLAGSRRRSRRRHAARPKFRPVADSRHEPGRGPPEIDEAVPAPVLTAARLAGRWLSTNPDYHTRAHTFLRAAAGQVPPDAADAAREAPPWPRPI